jgi:hypothetical protein
MVGMGEGAGRVDTGMGWGLGFRLVDRGWEDDGRVGSGVLKGP